MPQFTAIVPTRNRPDYLRQALASLLDQGSAPPPIIVVDDGSDLPATGQLEAEWQTCQIHRNERSKGVSAARNQGAKMANTDWLLFLDDDDWLAPGFIEALQRVIAQVEGKVDLIWSQKMPLREAAIQAGNIPDPADLRQRADGLEGLMDATCSGMAIRREAFLQVGGFDETLRVTEDRDLVFKLLTKGFLALPAPAAGLYFRIHDGPRLSKAGQAEIQARADLTVLRRHQKFLDQHPTLADRFLGRVAKRLWQQQYRLDAIAVTRMQCQHKPFSLRAQRRVLLWQVAVMFKRSHPSLLSEIDAS